MVAEVLAIVEIEGEEYKIPIKVASLLSAVTQERDQLLRMVDDFGDSKVHSRGEPLTETVIPIQFQETSSASEVAGLAERGWAGRVDVSGHQAGSVE